MNEMMNRSEPSSISNARPDQFQNKYCSHLDRHFPMKDGWLFGICFYEKFKLKNSEIYLRLFKVAQV